jgi:putative membrane protein
MGLNMKVKRWRCVGVILFAVSLCHAHPMVQGNAGDHIPAITLTDVASDWPDEPLVYLALLLTALGYGVGLRRLWKRAGLGHGVTRSRAFIFILGWAALFVALVSPLHPLGSSLFSAHMVQHELLMLVAAPLLVLGEPMIPLLHALPRRTAGALGRLSNASACRKVWPYLSHPLSAWIIHAAVLWIWHIPAFFQATQASDVVHAAQHLSFLASALLFWWSLLHAPGGVETYGAATLYLFTTALQSGFLGAFLTFTRRLWYPVYTNTTQSFGLTPMEDQVLGGLIMWIPACAIYIAAALALFAKWLKASDRSLRATEVSLVR